jgi:hypothetical protein
MISMSQSAGIEIIVVGMAALVQAVVDCGLEYAASRQTLTTDDGAKHTVDLIVRDEHGATVGVQLDAKTQAAKFIAKDCHGQKGKALAGRIAQRYATSRAIEELRQKGYQLVKEEKQRDGSVKLVASRWK